MITAEKNNLRRLVNAAKKELSLEEVKQRSFSVLGLLEQLPVFQNAKVVLLYWSIDKEVYTHDFIEKWSNKKLVLLPVICGDELRLKQFTGIHNMEPDKIFEIPEPVGDFFVDFDQIDLAVIPGVAFDIDNYRLGRGKGYYDKLLPNVKAIKVGVCFLFQRFDIVPTDKYDIPMDMVITEE